MVNDAGDVATTSPQNPPTRMRTMSVRLPGEAKTRSNEARTCPSSATNVAARKRKLAVSLLATLATQYGERSSCNGTLTATVDSSAALNLKLHWPMKVFGSEENRREHASSSV